MLEFNTNFKENIKNTFLQFSEFMNESTLLFEHFQQDQYKQFLPKLEGLFNELYSEFLESLTDAKDNFFFNFYYKAEDIEELPSLASQKTEYNIEKKQIQEQYRKLLSLEYNDELNDNKIFQSKLEDFVRMIKPDNEFNVEVKRKEVWYLTLDENDIRSGLVSPETTESVELTPIKPKADPMRDEENGVVDHSIPDPQGSNEAIVLGPGTEADYYQGYNPYAEGGDAMSIHIFSSLAISGTDFLFITELREPKSFCIGERNGGYITSKAGISTFTITGQSTVIVDHIQGESERDYADVIQFGKDFAFAVAEGPGIAEENIMKIRYDMTSKASVLSPMMFWRNGKNLRKTKIEDCIGFLSAIQKVTVLTGPGYSAHNKTNVTFDFPIEDFVFIDDDKILACGLSGRVAYKNFLAKSSRLEDLLSFNFELKENENVINMAVTKSRKYIAFSTKIRRDFSRVFIYERQGSDLIFHFATFDVANSLMKPRGNPLVALNFELVDDKTPILVGFEEGMGGGIRAWKLIDEVLHEVCYKSDFFSGAYQCSRTLMNCLWTLDSYGILRMTPFSNLFKKN